MICVICKTGRYKSGFVTVALTIGKAAVIIKEVPAMVCDQCGEYVLSSEVTEKVLKIVNDALLNGAEVEVRRFAA
jgi:YgiT-type zinc finger domain-containing protein